MLLGFPAAVWAVLGIEFVERLGYYAVAFSLFTYCTVMLKTGPSAANAIINGIYIVIPVAAFSASGVADSRVGRPRVLAAALAVYTVGLLLLFLSACPMFYNNFPYGPIPSGKVFFGVALTCFSAGYGAMKVCTNPIMADCVVMQHVGSLSEHAREDSREASTAHHGALEDESKAGILSSNAVPNLRDIRETQENCLSASSLCDPLDRASSPRNGGEEKPSLSEYGAVKTGDTSGAVSIAQHAALPLFEQQTQQALTRLFVYAYWIANVGGLLGSFVAPLLRNGESRSIDLGNGGHATTGYYWSFLLAAISVAFGGAFLYKWYHWLPQNAPAPSFVLVRVFTAALTNRGALLLGTKQLADPTTPLPHDWLGYACVPLQPSNAAGTAVDVTVVVAEDAVAEERSLTGAVTDPEWVADCRITLQVCKAFIALPVYWLLCNQFSTNLMCQAMALNLPSSVPEELFNNINTGTMLVVLALWDRWLLPVVLRHRVPSACLRVVLGFACMGASMIWCGLLQLAITRRGAYESEDAYVLLPGQQKLSAGWLVVPYVLQGFASALVDPTVMEVAYRDAPARMKGTVMGLYWVASSASGFLGLVLSPVMTPENATALFFSFAAAQAAVSALFYVLNRDRA